MAYIELLKKLLAEFGPRMTLALIVLAATGFALFKAARFFAGFLERMQASRDKIIGDVMMEVTASRERTAAHEVELAAVMATIRTTSDAQLVEAREARKEMHQRFNRASEEHTEMKERLSEIRGQLNA